MTLEHSFPVYKLFGCRCLDHQGQVNVHAHRLYTQCQVEVCGEVVYIIQAPVGTPLLVLAPVPEVDQDDAEVEHSERHDGDGDCIEQAQVKDFVPALTDQKLASVEAEKDQSEGVDCDEHTTPLADDSCFFKACSVVH